ncbi:MAG: acetolactate synthase small subunit, partial [Sneathiella sp.]
ALVKVVCRGEKRVEALRMADIFRARAVDTTEDSFVFEVTGVRDKVKAFVGLMEPLGKAEVCRTGVVAVRRGVKTI